MALPKIGKEQMEKIVSVFTAIVGLALVATVVQSPYTAPIFKAGGDAFSGSIRAARGK